MATTATENKKPAIFNLPNQLTAARLVLAFVLFFLVEFELWIACLVVFVVAAFTDWLDGYLARKLNLGSTLGRNLDPLVDKVLICGAFIFLLPVQGANLTSWIVTVVVARELIITGLRSFMESMGATFGADMLGKIKMGLQCAALIAIFITLRWPEPSLVVIQRILIYAMVAITALSGLQYLWRAFAVLKKDSR